MKNQIHLLKLLTLLFFITACTRNSAQSTVTLDYKAFGPQVIAHEIIGNEWWQWEVSGAPDPTVTYDVKVVVYRNIDLASVKEKFPVDKKLQIDYRYVTYQEAIAFLDKHVKHTMETPLTGITKTLTETKQNIIDHLD